MAPLAGMSGGAIEVLRCADYTLRTRRSSKGAELVGGFGGAADAAEGTAAACDLERVVALLGKCRGLGFSSVRSACAALGFAGC